MVVPTSSGAPKHELYLRTKLDKAENLTTSLIQGYISSFRSDFTSQFKIQTYRHILGMQEHCQAPYRDKRHG